MPLGALRALVQPIKNASFEAFFILRYYDSCYSLLFLNPLYLGNRAFALRFYPVQLSVADIGYLALLLIQEA